MAFLNFITFGEEELGEGRFFEARVMSGELLCKAGPGTSAHNLLS